MHRLRQRRKKSKNSTNGCKTSTTESQRETAAAEEEEVEEFYEKLQNVDDKISKGDIVVMMGDLNAKLVAEQTDAAGVIGKFGYGQRNGRGDRQIDFCRTNGLCIANTLFKQVKENRSWTWESPCGNYHNQWLK